MPGKPLRDANRCVPRPAGVGRSDAGRRERCDLGRCDGSSALRDGGANHPAERSPRRGSPCGRSDRHGSGRPACTVRSGTADRRASVRPRRRSRHAAEADRRRKARAERRDAGGAHRSRRGAARGGRAGRGRERASRTHRGAGNAHLVSDVECALHFFRGALAASTANVRINHRFIKDAEVVHAQDERLIAILTAANATLDRTVAGLA
jgi:hypothetical protein